MVTASCKPLISPLSTGILTSIMSKVGEVIYAFLIHCLFKETILRCLGPAPANLPVLTQQPQQQFLTEGWKKLTCVHVR